MITGGTDNHLLLVDARPYGLTGRQAETALREAGITLNRNVIPFDPNGSWYTSGLRLGTPAVTTLGMGADDMREVASIVHSVLESTEAVPDSKAKYRLDAGARRSQQGGRSRLRRSNPRQRPRLRRLHQRRVVRGLRQGREALARSVDKHRHRALPRSQAGYVAARE